MRNATVCSVHRVHNMHREITQNHRAQATRNPNVNIRTEKYRSIGHVSREAITETVNLVPYLYVKSLQPDIWRSDIDKFYLRLGDLQIIYMGLAISVYMREWQEPQVFRWWAPSARTYLSAFWVENDFVQSIHMTTYQHSSPSNGRQFTRPVVTVFSSRHK